jgi:hypothetical protein
MMGYLLSKPCPFLFDSAHLGVTGKGRTFKGGYLSQVSESVTVRFGLA